MSKPGDFNSEVLQSLELAGRVISGSFTATTTPSAVVSDSTQILWVILQNQGSSNIHFGASAVASSGSNLGPRMTPNGETPILKIGDLSSLFVVSASGSQTGSYIAGIKGTYS